MIQSSTILFVCNNSNQVRTFAPVVKLLRERQRDVLFLSLDRYYNQGASLELDSLEEDYFELPSRQCLGRWYEAAEYSSIGVLEAAVEIEALLRYGRFEAVVLGHDVEFLEQVIIREAERQGVPTIRLQDGIQSAWPHEREHEYASTIYPFDGGCDLLLTWNEDIVERLRNRGVAGQAIAVGNPRMDSLADWQGYRVGEAPYRVVIAMQCFTRHRQFPLAMELSLYHRLVHLVLQRKDVEVVLKLHPQQLGVSEYLKLEEYFPERFSIVQEADSLELLTTADMLITISSTVAVESALMGISTIRADHLLREDLDEFADGEVRFKEALHSEQFPRDIYLNLNVDNRQEFLTRFGAPLDGRSAERSADAIEGLLTAPQMSDTPQLSVLLVHEKGDALSAVRSVLRTSGPSLEVILVDVSPDASLAARVNKEINDPRVRVLTATGHSVASATNLGVQSCRANFIARLGVDCIALPGWTERVHNHLREKSTTRLFTSWYGIRNTIGLIHKVHCVTAGQTPMEFAQNEAAILPLQGIGFRKEEYQLLVDGAQGVEEQLFCNLIGDLGRSEALHVEQAVLFLSPFDSHFYSLTEIKPSGELPRIRFSKEVSDYECSVVVSNWNAESLAQIRDAVSAFDSPVELLLLVADDAQVGREALGGFDECRLIPVETRAKGWNQSVRCSRGRYLCFVDAALEIPSNWISEHVACVRNSNDLAIACSTQRANKALGFLAEAARLGALCEGSLMGRDGEILSDSVFSLPRSLCIAHDLSFNETLSSSWGVQRAFVRELQRRQIPIQSVSEVCQRSQYNIESFVQDQELRNDDIVYLVSRHPEWVNELLGIPVLTSVHMNEWEESVLEEIAIVPQILTQINGMLEECAGADEQASQKILGDVAVVLDAFSKFLMRRALVRHFSDSPEFGEVRLLANG